MKATMEKQQEKETMARERFAEYLRRFGEELQQSPRDERWQKVGSFLNDVRCRSGVDQMRDLFIHFLGYLHRDGLVSLPLVEDLRSGLPVVVADSAWEAGFDAGARASGFDFYRRSARVDLRIAGWSLVAHNDLPDGKVFITVKDEIGRAIEAVGEDDAAALDEVRAAIARLEQS